MGLIPLALNDFKDFFTLFPKCFSSFVHTTCSLSVLVIYLAFGEVHLRFAQHYQTARLVESKTLTSHAYRRNGTFALVGTTFQEVSSDCQKVALALALQFLELRFLRIEDSSIGCSL